MSDFQEFPEVVQEVRGALVCIVSFTTMNNYNFQMGMNTKFAENLIPILESI